jgi:hypothetical protein
MKSLWLALVVWGGGALAQEQELPAFQPCMDREIARYERALRRAQQDQLTQEFEIGGTTGVDLCGAYGIVRCDLTETPYACQRALRVEQDALQAKVVAHLPDTLPAVETPEWHHDLYGTVHALALGHSAGPDCAGDDEPRQVWCEAWEANRRLSSAILAWQIARFAGAVPPATETGWAQHPPPTRPIARPEPTSD